MYRDIRLSKCLSLVIIVALFVISGIICAKGIKTMNKHDMVLTSTAFINGGIIPYKHANSGYSKGANISIPLSWFNIPSGTKSLALVMSDNSANDFVHWMVVNIPPETKSFYEGASGNAMPSGCRELTNDFGSTGYGGPTPPNGTGEHNYVFNVYALNVSSVKIDEKTSLKDFISALKPYIISKGSYSGKMSPPK